TDRDRNEQIDCCTNRANIDACIDNVCDYQSKYDRIEQSTWVIFPKNACQSSSAHHSDFGTNKLNGCHERKGEQCSPERLKTQRCASRRIGADSRRIIVGSTRNETRAENLQESLNGIGFAF